MCLWRFLQGGLIYKGRSTLNTGKIPSFLKREKAKSHLSTRNDQHCSVFSRWVQCDQLLFDPAVMLSLPGWTASPPTVSRNKLFLPSIASVWCSVTARRKVTKNYANFSLWKSVWFSPLGMTGLSWASAGTSFLCLELGRGTWEYSTMYASSMWLAPQECLGHMGYALGNMWEHGLSLTWCYFSVCSSSVNSHCSGLVLAHHSQPHCIQHHRDLSKRDQKLEKENDASKSV